MFDQQTLDRLNAGVPAAGSDEDPATAAKIAAVEFQAIDEEIDACFGMSQWVLRSRILGNSLRFAAAFVRMTKPELTEAVRKILYDEDGAGGEAYFETIEAFDTAAAECRAYADVLTAAHMRLLIVGSVIGLEPDEVQP
jgi:hypothetical protein